MKNYNNNKQFTPEFQTIFPWYTVLTGFPLIHSNIFGNVRLINQIILSESRRVLGLIHKNIY